MAEFYISLSNYDIAKQISDMVNEYNRWYSILSPYKIMNSPARYFVEIEGNRVVGCASYICETDIYTKIQHICVLPQYRCNGIAYKLTSLAIKHVQTEYVYMNIRADNVSSLYLANSLGFTYIGKHWFKDHWTLTLGRRTKYARSNQQFAQ